jgi:predicted ATP-binding protein involved in virulence
MKITEIAVKNLFGMFNHVIPLNNKERITIIHGSNGIGKTAILKMIYGFFKGNDNNLRVIPFSELIITFDDKSVLKVTKDIKTHVRRPELNLEYTSKKKSEKETAKLKPLDPVEFEEIPSRILRQKYGIARLDSETWLYLPTEEKLSYEELIERFGEQFLIKFLNDKDEPAWLKTIKSSISIRFIETQRLLSFEVSPMESLGDFHSPGRRVPLTPAVSTYSEELSSSIQNTLAKYGLLSQELDRTFPARLVKSKTPTHDINKLKEKLNSLETKRLAIMAAGILDKPEEMGFKDLQGIDEKNITVLSVYAEDTERKLAIFDKITNQIDLLKRIINKKFLNKEMQIDKKTGFVFKTLDDKSLSPTVLSSGEQHELILFYELLFKVSPDSLILIDEPELSLHVAWQQEFLKDLADITKLAEIDVLIATHSPQIIHDRWDLTVELKGSKE